MAITAALRAQLIRSAVAYAGTIVTRQIKFDLPRVKVSVESIARYLVREYGPGKNVAYSTAAAAARRAVAGMEAAKSLNRRTATRLPDASHAEDPALDYSTERYRYLVRVTYTDEFGNTRSTVIDYRSDTVPTRRELEDWVKANTDVQGYQGDYRRGSLGAAGPDAVVDVQVIFAGMRK